MTIFKTFITCTVFFFASQLMGQDISQNAIGIRIGDGDGFGTEVSYQRYLGENNRLELDFGWIDDNDFDGYKLTGIYQWVWILDGKFNWYAGAGAGFGSYDIDHDNNGINPDDDSETFLLVAGQVGIEYNFDIPIQVSVDTRPELGFGDFNDDLGLGIALSVRYRF